MKRRKVIKLQVRVTGECDGTSKMTKLAGGGVSVSMGCKGWKDFDCVFETEDGARYRYGCKGFAPPEIGYIEEQFNSKPAIFFTRL